MNTLAIRAAIALSLSASILFAKEDPEAYSKTVSVKQILRTSRTAGGGPLVFPAGSSEVTGIEVTIPAGSSTGWHRHARSGFAYVLKGRLQVVLKDSTRNEFIPGQAFAEVANTLHDGIALGTEDVKLVAFFLSDSGKPISTKP
ncbi:MAG TPA: cupin domain-containing protein [Fibrobacteria bacterium]|nr:cupin domain-containing protein [Fibrobacteria bacterium]HOX51923.1 cupin domain-containing protein [Fibrobacteria bacterium]